MAARIVNLVIDLVDVSDIFYLFLLGEGQGESEVPRGGGGIGFLLKIPGGGSPSRRAKGPGACLRGIWGGRGANNFVFGAEIPTKRKKSRKAGSLVHQIARSKLQPRPRS